MRVARCLGLFGAFVLGACASAALPSGALNASGPLAATIVSLARAPRFTNPPATAEVAHLARGERAYVGRLSMKAGAKVPVHRDATEEFIHVLEGSGQITIDGERRTIHAGDTVFMPAGAEVRFENGDAPLVGLQVFAGPEPAQKYEAWTPVATDGSGVRKGNER